MIEIQTIKKLANSVYKSLGSGHSESIYHEALLVELRLNKFICESERAAIVTYKEHYVGIGLADIVIRRDGDHQAVLELKNLGKGKIGAPEKKQCENYMDSLGINQGFVVNFPKAGTSSTVLSEEAPAEVEEVQKAQCQLVENANDDATRP